jgi:hypothetical protein
MSMPSADKLRYAIRELDLNIDYARICMSPDCRPKDKARLPEFIAEYQRLIRIVHELKEARQAEIDIVSALCEPHLPKPFAQPVGVKGEEYFNRGWAAFTVPAITTPAVEAKRLAA